VTRSCCARPAAGGTRPRARRPSAWCRARRSGSRPAPSTGTERRRTRGSRTSPSSRRARTSATSGSSLSPTRCTASCRERRERMTILNETYTLSNGVEIPQLGLGTWFIDDDKAADAVRQAISIGYRNIDTAQAYGNERGVGEGVRTSGVARDELFVSTKLAAEVKDYEGAVAAIDESLEKLGLEYVDLMLIHAPQPWEDFRGGDYSEGNLAAWRALEEAHRAGQDPLDRRVELPPGRPGEHPPERHRRPAREPDPGARRQHAHRADRLLPVQGNHGRGVLPDRARRDPQAPGRRGHRREVRRERARSCASATPCS
jgi:hypothetical protein